LVRASTIIDDTYGAVFDAKHHSDTREASAWRCSPRIARTSGSLAVVVWPAAGS